MSTWSLVSKQLNFKAHSLFKQLQPNAYFVANNFLENHIKMSVSTSEKPLLFSYCRSSCAWRVRLVLNLKSIRYETHALSLSNSYSEAQIKEYSAINPMMQVPALKIDGHTLIESVAIMHYLEETRPEVPLLPADPLKRAKVREIVEVVCAGIQPMQNVAVLKKINDDERLEWARHYISRGFRAIEQLLKASSGKYCVGDKITFADCCLVPQVYNALCRYEMDLSAYPNIVRIYKELEAHAAFKAAHAEAQPDFTPECLKDNL